MLQVESLISHFRWKTIHYRKKPGLCPEPRMPRNSGFEIRSFGVRYPVLRTPPHSGHPSRTSTPAKGRTPNLGRSGIVFEAEHNPASPVRVQPLINRPDRQPGDHRTLTTQQHRLPTQPPLFTDASIIHTSPLSLFSLLLPFPFGLTFFLI